MKRNTESARLAYEAVVRDICAQTETAYYQVVLDGSLTAVKADTVR